MSEENQEFLELSGIHGPEAKHETLTESEFPVLQGLSPVNMRILNHACRVMHVSQGVEILHERDTPHYLFFIKQGKVAIARMCGSRNQVIAHLKSGELYGEFGALRNKTRYASVVTVEPTVIIRVDLSAVHQVLEADSKFRQHLEEILTFRMLESFFFSHPAFENMRPEVRSQLAHILDTRFYERDSRIFNQGDKPEGVHLIVSGEAEVRFLNRNKNETLLEVRRDNDVIGEVARNNGSEMAYSAIASGDLDTLLLDAKSLKTIREVDPVTMQHLEKFITKRSAETVQRLKQVIR